MRTVLNNVQFVGPSGVLLYRYYIMQLLAIGRDEDEDLKDNLSEEDMADAIAETNIFATHTVSMAATDYTEPTGKDDLIPLMSFAKRFPMA